MSIHHLPDVMTHHRLSLSVMNATRAKKPTHLSQRVDQTSLKLWIRVYMEDEIMGS